MSIQSISTSTFQKWGVIWGTRRYLLPLAVAMACQPAFANTSISEVTVINDADGQAVQLRIEGVGFGSDPQINLGNYLDSLIVSDFTCGSNTPLAPLASECLIADLPVGVEDGDFLLSMIRKENGCEGEKPAVLSFIFEPALCDATSNFQEGKFECSDNPGPSGTEVSIELVKHANKIDVLPMAPDVLYPGDIASFSSNEKHLKSELKFDIKENGISVQSLNIHASCSKPLAVGDVFGSLELVEYVPGESSGKEKSNEENSAVYDLSIGAIGPVGPVGPQGEQGPQGEIGPQGEQGPIGLTGEQGTQGEVGPVGPQGEQGPQGEIGPQGEQGLIGLTGEQGIQGEVGPKGDSGADGAQGPVGPMGPAGPIGLTGVDGADGAPGLQGIQGAIGPQGPIGPEGPPGPGIDSIDLILEDDWTEAVMLNGWHTYGDGSGYGPAVYYKDKQGRVHLRGLVEGGSCQSPMFILPPEYRPAYRIILSTMTQGGMARLDVLPTGEVMTWQPCGGGWVSVSGVSFRSF